MFFLKITLLLFAPLCWMFIKQLLSLNLCFPFYFLALGLAFSARRRSRRSFFRIRGVPSDLVRFFNVLKAMVSNLLR